jgi:hypothetical protein
MDTNDELNADLPVEPERDLPIERDGETPQPDEQSPSENYQLRLQRVRDYQNKSIANANELESNLGSINSGLLRIALRLEETIEEAMARTPVPVERMQRVYQAIDTHLRVSKQIDRFAQVELRGSDPRRRSSIKKIDVDRFDDKSPEPAAGQSEDLNN